MKLIMILVGVYLNFINLLSNRIGGKQAFFIFCYPFKARLTKSQQKFLDTSHKFKLEVEDQDIQCYRWGQGDRKIVLVHGWQSNTYRWKKYINTFSKDEFTIYAFDAPGHGNSTGRIGNVPLFEKSLKKLACHIGQIETIVSHSIGSFSSLYYINQNPDNQPRKLVTLATPSSVNDFLDFYFNKLKLSNRTIQNFKVYFAKYAMKNTDYFNLSTLINHNTADGLIIHDKTDKVVPASYSEKLHSIWPKSQLVLTDGLGHKLKSETVISLINEFIRSPA